MCSYKMYVYVLVFSLLLVIVNFYNYYCWKFEFKIVCKFKIKNIKSFIKVYIFYIKMYLIYRYDI